MAKGLRASTRKKNNAVLRAKIFGPAVDARTERLSAKLQELSAKSKPESDKIMEVDEEAKDEEPSAGSDEEMDVDAQGAKMKPVTRKMNSKKGKSGRIEKKVSKRKQRHSVTFAPIQAKIRRQAAQKQKRG